MSDAISIVTPAYRAEKTLARMVASVVAQTHENWELIIVADDSTDYEALLADMGVRDGRFRFFKTGASGSGSPPARNIGIGAAQNRYLAILDADDLFHHEKLERVMAVMPECGLVSCALQVADADLAPLRLVGAGDNKILTAGAYKFTNISMDSMLVYDRHKGDPLFDPSFPCLTDIEFLLKLFGFNERCYHLGMPLHTYVKQPGSISNKPGATGPYVETKKRLLKLLGEKAYPLAAATDYAGLIDFWQVSLRGEQLYGQAALKTPGLLFEDHLEGLLKAASTSDL